MFLMMLYNNFSFVSNLRHVWHECSVDLNTIVPESVVTLYTKNALIDLRVECYRVEVVTSLHTKTVNRTLLVNSR